MTDGKQGAAEWLRGIAQRKCNCHEVVRMFGFACGESPCTECIPRLVGAIADRIDAERALPEGIEWPRFEDGELVRIGDELEFEGKTMLVCDATFYADGWALWCDREDMNGRLYGKYGERVKRPTPKALDADGVPIEVGDTVYFVGGSGARYAVKDIGFEPDGAFVDIIDEEGRYSTMANPERLTHERPDSWEQLEEDAYHLVMSEYLETPEKDVSDIVRRAKALARRRVRSNDREA